MTSVFGSRLEKMFEEQDKVLKQGHTLLDAILRNIVSTYEELRAVQQLDQLKHQDNVRQGFEMVPYCFEPGKQNRFTSESIFY